MWDLAARDQAAKVSAEFNNCLTSDPHRGSVVRAMWQNFGRPFMWAGVVKFVHDGVLFTGEGVLDFSVKLSRLAMYRCADISGCKSMCLRRESGNLHKCSMHRYHDLRNIIFVSSLRLPDTACLDRLLKLSHPLVFPCLTCACL